MHQVRDGTTYKILLANATQRRGLCVGINDNVIAVNDDGLVHRLGQFPEQVFALANALVLVRERRQ